jgi:hypothetical protein
VGEIMAEILVRRHLAYTPYNAGKCRQIVVDLIQGFEDLGKCTKILLKSGKYRLARETVQELEGLI